MQRATVKDREEAEMLLMEPARPEYAIQGTANAVPPKSETYSGR